MTSDELPEPTTAEPASELGPLLDRIQQFVNQSVAERTREAYRADWEYFADWCGRQELEARPAASATVAAYLSALADGSAARDGEPYAAATIGRRLTTIRLAHRAAGLEDPTDAELVDKTWRGIRRDDDVAVDREGRVPLLAEDIRRLVDALDEETLKGARDRALILLGYTTAARRSELAALDVGDLEFRPQGVVVQIRQSKTDQEGVGRTPTVHYADDYCAVSAVEAWLERAGLEDGPVFRTLDRWGNLRDNRLSGKSINRAVKAAAEAAGMDASQIGAHSLRAGHVTQRKVAGAADGAIMDQTGHSSASTMRRYDRRAKQFRHDVPGELGL